MISKNMKSYSHLLSAPMVLISMIAFSPVQRVQAQSYQSVISNNINTNNLKRLQPSSSNRGFYPYSNPESYHIMQDENNDLKLIKVFEEVSKNLSLLPNNCEVDFNDPVALSLIPDSAGATFAVEPFWNQQCDIDNHVYVRPYFVNHFHLLYENPTCMVLESGDFGEMLEDGTCKAFDDPAQQPRYLSTMLSRDVIELTVNDFYGYPVAFDFNGIRVVGSDPVHVCFKPADAINGPLIAQEVNKGLKPVKKNNDPWVAQEVNEELVPTEVFCWTNLPTGLWDLSEWGGNVSAVRLIQGDVGMNFQVDDISIGTY